MNYSRRRMRPVAKVINAVSIIILLSALMVDDVEFGPWMALWFGLVILAVGWLALVVNVIEEKGGKYYDSKM